MFRSVLFCIAIMLCASAGYSATLLQENFEAYATGSYLGGQGGWQSNTSVACP